MKSFTYLGRKLVTNKSVKEIAEKNNKCRKIVLISEGYPVEEKNMPT
jgi:hypothetical protein